MVRNPALGRRIVCLNVSLSSFKHTIDAARPKLLHIQYQDHRDAEVWHKLLPSVGRLGGGVDAYTFVQGCSVAAWL
jgi:hypothetical protein